jgi:hypothetical protein
MAPELQTTVQQLYYDTLQRLDAALHNVCSSFTTEGYTKVICLITSFYAPPSD